MLNLGQQADNAGCHVRLLPSRVVILPIPWEAI